MPFSLIHPLGMGNVIVDEQGKTKERHGDKAIAEARLAALNGTAPLAAAPGAPVSAAVAEVLSDAFAVLAGNAGPAAEAIRAGDHDHHLAGLETAEVAGAGRKSVLRAIRSRQPASGAEG